MREALADPEVAVAGCIGALGVRSIAWWEGSVTWASFIHRYGELGGGDLPGFAWDAAERPPFARTGEVDVVDGFLLVLSPWAVRNLRFDESLGSLHGYDVDFCLQARAAGRKVVTADFRAVHNHSLDLVSDPEGWVEAHIRMQEKWDGQDPRRHRGRHRLAARSPGARSAEAEASRAAAVSKQLQYDAREREFQRDARRDRAEHRLAPHAAAAAREPLAPARAGRAARPAALVLRARGGSRPSTRPTARVAMPARWRSRDSRSASANALESSSRRSTASCRAARCSATRRRRRAWTCASARWKTRLASSRATSGLRSHGSSTSAIASAHGASALQTTPRPKNAGTTASRRSSRSATKSSTAVRTPLRGPPSRAAAPR